MAQKRSWDLQEQQKRRDYLFRAYVQVCVPAWHVRAGLLRELAKRCGEHHRWGEMIHVGPRLERQEWAIFGFKEHERKLQFEAGVPAILAIELKEPEPASLPNGFADPNRDFSSLARRMLRKGHDYRR